ncbi:MAG: amidohydrolase [Firmicutes bacterium]|nr:amidohydrolase [Bacillota bacterium]
MRTIIHDVSLLDDTGLDYEGYVTIDGRTITSVGRGQCQEPPTSFDMRIDGKNRLLLPGFINAHGHAAMSLLRGFADDIALETWLSQKIWPAESRLTPPDIKIGTQLAMLEMIETGTTTFTDMYFAMDQVAEAVEEGGMRAVLGRGLVGLTPSGEQALQETRDFARAYHRSAEGRITVNVAPHAPYTCLPDFMHKVLALTEELALPIQIHVSETAKEVADCIETYGATPVAHLAQLGVFAYPTLAAHCVHVNQTDIEILRAHDVHIAHNPGSNLKLGSGVAPLPQFLASGLIVGLGTDGAASNNKLDMWEEMRLAALLHKGVQEDATLVSAATAFALVTSQGAKALFLEQGLGHIEVGAPADIQLIDISGPRYFPRHNLLAHIVYSSCAMDVTDVFVDGKLLYRNRTFLTLDRERIVAEASAIGARLG